MTYDPAETVRPIQTAADVESVLASPQESFDELMECVQVAGGLGEWELRHRSAERLYQVAVVDRRPRRLVDAATAVIGSLILLARTLDDLRPRVESALNWVQDEAGRHIPANMLSQRQIAALNQLLVLLSDPQYNSLVRVSKLLRRIDRSDLAVEAAERAVRLRPDSVPALTTLAAGLADIQECFKGFEVIERALALRPDDARTLTTASRLLSEIDRPDDALEFAQRAFDLLPDRFTAHRLLAAAMSTGDDEAVRQAQQLITESHDEPDVADDWTQGLTVRILIEAGQLDRARATLASLQSRGSSGDMAKLIVRLRDELRRATLRSQPTLFP